MEVIQNKTNIGHTIQSSGLSPLDLDHGIAGHRFINEKSFNQRGKRESLTADKKGNAETGHGEAWFLMQREH